MERLTVAAETAAAVSGFTGTVAVSDASGPIFRKAFGYRNRADMLPNDEGTRFAIASGTKPFTALGIGRLVQEGKLTLSAPVGDVAQDFAGWIDPSATIGQLLTHRSGCYDYLDEETMEDYDNFRVALPWYDLETPSDYLPLFAGHAPKFDPGERFSYSNGGYVALGALIERISGQRYRDFIKAEVLDPAGMTDSGFFAFDALPSNVAAGYLDGGLRTNVYRLPIRGGGDGGMYTTAADLDAFWRSLLGHRILREGLLEDWLSPRAEISERTSYAYGFYRRKKDGSYYIVGSDHGVGFDSRYLPERDLVVSILSNESDGEEAMRDAILGCLDG
jgi:CubicO group peptidase (beta-lactamase class C family)